MVGSSIASYLRVSTAVLEKARGACSNVRGTIATAAKDEELYPSLVQKLIQSRSVLARCHTRCMPELSDMPRVSNE